MKNYIRNLIPLIALVFISLACQAQRKRVTASEFRSGWNHHIRPRCFKSERAYIEYNGIKYEISPRIIGYCAVEQEVDFDSHIVIADSSIKKNTKHWSVRSYPYQKREREIRSSMHVPKPWRRTLQETWQYSLRES